MGRPMDSDFTGPLNFGSEEMVTINQFAQIVMVIAVDMQIIKHLPDPLGVRVRNSENTLFKKLGWTPSESLNDGLQETYVWIVEQEELKKCN